ncbi:MAG TPA: class I SAM-dependent methyltransferase [Candidatus Omnitrophota bacterium]|nr:class I SAM-dependent methyltransferase [Candidatus Omnitrophota bacterium]
MRFLDSLKLPEAALINDLDDPQSTLIHRQIIRKKPFLKKLYMDFYRMLAGGLRGVPPGAVVELGSGGGLIEDVLPRVITSDILFLPHLQICFRVDQAPFKNGSVSAFVMLNVFHHVKDTQAFFEEMTRCLRPGGKIVMIEPANSFWGRWVYQNFHHETFDPSAGWGVEGEGALSCGNGALPWIVFQRDYGVFSRRYPRLVLKRFRPFGPLGYLLSGGVSFRQLLPTWGYPMIKALEWLLSPLSPWLSMFYYIELEKEGENFKSVQGE